MTDYSLDNLHDRERSFAESVGLNSVVLDRLHGIRRLQATNLPTDWHKLAVWIAAPVLAGFTTWLASHDTRGARFFGVMREGGFISQLLRAVHGLPAREIWLNRNLTMLAAFGCGDDESLINWLVRTRVEPLSAYGAAVELIAGAKEDEFSHEPLDVAAAYQLLDDWKLNGLYGKARARAEPISDVILKHWQNCVDQRTNTLLKDVTPATYLMDFACAGNIQRALEKILHAKGIASHITGLNFAMTRGSQWATKDGCAFEGYLSEAGQPRWFAEAYGRSPELMEIFAGSSAGPLTGYTADGNPVFGQNFLASSQIELVHDLQASIVSAAMIYKQQLGDQLSADVARCVWGRLLLQPSKVEADTMGDWPLDAGLDGKNRRVLAKPSPAEPETTSKAETPWPAGARARHAA